MGRALARPAGVHAKDGVHQISAFQPGVQQHPLHPFGGMNTR
ncbi:MAG TPA: hypothetical protein VI543_05775 [Sulfuricaulis sp.]|nr:hypothetical protein [Sulfuricaulis sp.]